MFEKVRYFFYKEKLKRVAKKSSPLISFPFLIFVDLELDEIFKKEGLKAAKKAAEKWPEEYKEKMKNIVLKFKNSRIKDLNNPTAFESEQLKS